MGYRYADQKGHGKILVPDGAIADIIREALEGYASGRFATQSAFKEFLESHTAFPNKNKRGKVHFKTVRDILERPLYAGYLDVPNWGITMQPGKHEAIISYETWEKVQSRLKGNHQPRRRDVHDDFPLRGYVSCSCCGNPLTAGWSRGVGGRYAYYLCQHKENGVKCARYGKSIRKADIEGAFKELLTGMRPTREIFFMSSEMFEGLWQDRIDNMSGEASTAKKALIKIERQSDQLIERIVETDSASLVAAYENKVRKLEKEKVALT